TNLQERFLIGRIGAAILYNDRVLTRIVQGFGRCTRSATDYSAVILSGDELVGHLLKKENRQYFHPELQAELQFGIEQSKNASEKEMMENFDLFLAQGNEWKDADAEIVQIRESMAQAKLPGMPQLREAADLEVDYMYALWHGDYAKCLEICRQILAV